MHAFLIVTNNLQQTTGNIDGIVKTNRIKTTLEFPFGKVEDVRKLNSFTALSLKEPTAIVLKNVEGGTVEASNAFLKNLEEPQENLYYILTTSNLHAVLPTIVSRCQVIKISNFQFPISNENEIKKFLDLSVGRKLAYVDKIRDRNEAIEFVESLIYALHENLYKAGGAIRTVGEIDAANFALAALKANGNVTLQLTNMVVSGV